MGTPSAIFLPSISIAAPAALFAVWRQGWYQRESRITIVEQRTHQTGFDETVCDSVGANTKDTPFFCDRLGKTGHGRFGL